MPISSGSPVPTPKSPRSQSPSNQNSNNEDTYSSSNNNNNNTRKASIVKSPYEDKGLLRFFQSKPTMGAESSNNKDDAASKAERGEINKTETKTETNAANQPPPDITIQPPSRRGSNLSQANKNLPWGYKFFGFQDWLPRLRTCSAWCFLFVNIFFPGFGTIFFSLAWLSGDDFAIPTTMKPRWAVASIGILYGLAQVILAPFLFGWGWAIMTAVMALKQARWIEIMDQREAKAKAAMEAITEEEDDKGKSGTASKPKRKRRPTPPPTPPESPPPDWVYRLYPYSSEMLKPPGQGGETKTTPKKSSRSSSQRSNPRSTPKTTSSQADSPASATSSNTTIVVDGAGSTSIEEHRRITPPVKTVTTYTPIVVKPISPKKVTVEVKNETKTDSNTKDNKDATKSDAKNQDKK